MLSRQCGARATARSATQWTNSIVAIVRDMIGSTCDRHEDPPHLPAIARQDTALREEPICTKLRHAAPLCGEWVSRVSLCAFAALHGAANVRYKFYRGRGGSLAGGESVSAEGRAPTRQGGSRGGTPGMRAPRCGTWGERSRTGLPARRPMVPLCLVVTAVRKRPAVGFVRRHPRPRDDRLGTRHVLLSIETSFSSHRSTDQRRDGIPRTPHCSQYE